MDYIDIQKYSMGGVHYREEVKAYQVVLVLITLFVIIFAMNGFLWMPAIKMYGVLISVIAGMAILSLGTLYIISSMAGVTGLKEGTKVTDEREKEY